MSELHLSGSLSFQGLGLPGTLESAGALWQMEGGAGSDQKHLRGSGLILGV